jgi:dTDP-4-amino-4,6-dideoxygalactose transaminase
VGLPVERASCRHVYHQFVVRVPHRDAVRAGLTAAGVQTGVHYPIPIHLQPAYRDLGYGLGDFPVCEGAAADVLSIPIYPELTDTQAAHVASSLRAAVSAGAPT